MNLFQMEVEFRRNMSFRSHTHKYLGFSMNKSSTLPQSRNTRSNKQSVNSDNSGKRTVKVQCQFQNQVVFSNVHLLCQFNTKANTSGKQSFDSSAQFTRQSSHHTGGNLQNTTNVTESFIKSIITRWSPKWFDECGGLVYVLFSIANLYLKLNVEAINRLMFVC